MARRSRSPRATRATRCSWRGGRSPVSASHRSVGRAARRSSRGSPCATTTRWCSGSTPPIASASTSATRCRCSPATAYPVGPPPPPLSLRVVGLATFAAISQQGTDEARLGVGALVTRPTFERLLGSDGEPARVDHGQPGRRHRPDRAHRRQPRRRRGRARGQDAVVHRCATRRAPAARRGLAGARRCRRGRPPAPRRRARPGRLVADPSERRRAVGAPGPRVLPLPARPHRGVADRPSRASPPSSSGSRSGSPSVDSPSAPSPDRSPWSTTPSSPPWLVVALALAVGASVGAGALVAGQVARHVVERRHPPRRRRPPRLTRLTARDADRRRSAWSRAGTARSEVRR